MAEISSLIFILVGGTLLLAALYVFYKLMIFFVHGWKVLVYLLIEKNGFLGLIFMVLMFVMVLPLAFILTIYLGYSDQRDEDRFWKNVEGEIKSRKRNE
jgi:uncharacterized membrane protein YhdT